ncbi:MAG: sigma-54 interaction domain-containing protein [Betaproteobacteria bacterium]
MTAADCHEQLVGDSPGMRVLREDIAAASRSDAKVLITGETGVGKEVVARLIHRASSRHCAPLATINCAGVPDSLMESELFGHVRGSFTGAFRDRVGILETAARGTVFLDEVGEMSLRMQAALLRFLETGEIQRVGADRARTITDVRVIAATNRDLMLAIDAGTFRQDLYYRLNVLHLTVPPLRERRDDIPTLLSHFMECYSLQHGVLARSFSPDALKILTDYRWPGNVREMKNVIERIVLRPIRPTIEPDDLPGELFESRKTIAIGKSPETASAPDVAVELTARMLDAGESFWSAVHAPFMARDLSRANLRRIVVEGLDRTAGNYRMVVELFNMPPSDYKRFLSFLRKHDCHVAYQPFRRRPTAFALPTSAAFRPTDAATASDADDVVHARAS